ncbi:MAG: PAS domain S-box protein, partial [Ignavibacteria bacterium]|nr:PAS domain S-box protein [Ignavibacteria bacterium]
MNDERKTKAQFASELRVLRAKLKRLEKDGDKRRRVEDALRERAERFRTLYENSAAGFYRATPDGRILSANLTLVEMLGYSSFDELSTRNIEKDGFGPSYKRAQFLEMIEKEGQAKGLESAWKRRDGTEVYVSESARAIRDPQGKTMYYDGIVEDISERKRAEETLRESEQRFRSLFDNMLEGFAYCKMLFDHGKPQDFVYLGVNKAFEELTGLKDVVGKKVSEVIPGIKESNPELLDVYGRVAQTGKPERLESYLKPLGLWLSIAVYSPASQYFIAVFDNISERKLAEDESKRAEEALRQSEARHRAILDSANDGIVTADSNGIIFGWNNAAERIFGYSYVEIIGQPLTNLMPQIYRTGHTNGLKSLQADGNPYIIGNTVELQGVRKDGSEFPMELSSAAWELGKGQFYTGIIRDITERKMLQRQFLEAQKMESIGTLASGIAHDFNNILGIILGHLTLLERTRDNEAQFKESVSSVSKAVQRGASLVRQILTFARKTETQLEPVSINCAIKEVAKMLDETFPKTITLSLNLDKSVPNISMDSTQLHQALLNLCINARDAMDGQGILKITTQLVKGEEVTARFLRANVKHYVRVSVADTGTGMDEGTSRHIFEPFFTTKGKEKGTGLGLAVVYGVLEAHSGFVDVETSLGKGTTFNLFIPVPEDKLEENHVEDGKPEDI